MRKLLPQRATSRVAKRRGALIVPTLFASRLLCAVGTLAVGYAVQPAPAAAESVTPTPQIPSQPPGQLPGQPPSKPPGAERKTPPNGSPHSKPPAKPDADSGAGTPRPDHASVPHPSTLKTVAQRKKALANLYERLSAADSAESAEAVAEGIEQMWLHSGSDTTNLLMERALEALHGKKPQVALEILDGVVKLQPGYAEAWNRRAYVHFSQKDYGKALLDLRRVLAIEPRHFKAINGLATILREFGDKRGALKAFRMLVDVHPFDTDAKQAIKELEREVEGESL